MRGLNIFTNPKKKATSVPHAQVDATPYPSSSVQVNVQNEDILNAWYVMSLTIVQFFFV